MVVQLGERRPPPPHLQPAQPLLSVMQLFLPLRLHRGVWATAKRRDEQQPSQPPLPRDGRWPPARGCECDTGGTRAYEVHSVRGSAVAAILSAQEGG